MRRAKPPARFLGCSPDEVTFGANMTSLSFALSRTAGRGFEPGDEIVVTRLDHDGNVAPWLELAHDLGLVVRFADITDDCDVDLDRPRASALRAHAGRRLPGRVERRRHADGRRADRRAGTRRRRARLGRRRPRGAARADRRRRLGRRRPPLLAVQVLRPAPGGRVRPAARSPRAWRPYKVRPQADEPVGHRFETGTQPYELLAGFVAAVEYVESIGWDGDPGARARRSASGSSTVSRKA